MKKILFVCMVMLLPINGAFAITIGPVLQGLCTKLSSTPAMYDIVTVSAQNCLQRQYAYYKCTSNGVATNYRVYECKTCSAGYTLTTGSYATGNGNIPFQTCGEGSCCTNCDDIGWTNDLYNSQKYITKTCNETECKCYTYTSYRCKAGYYGNPGSTITSTACQSCPTGGTSVATDNKTKYRCYSTTTSGTDATGSWEYTDKCYYSD